MPEQPNQRNTTLAKRTIGGETWQGLHPSWKAFIKFCQEMGHGEVERLRIQDGLPVGAELARTKVKFTS